jgi:hypothetical protein
VLCAAFLVFLLLGPAAGLAQGPKPPPPPPANNKPKAKPKPKHAAPRRVQPARLTVMTGFGGCLVSVDGREVGTTDSNGMLRVNGVSPGAHSILVQAPGHRTYASSFQAVASEEAIVSAVIEPLPGLLFVDTTPLSGALVRVGEHGIFDAGRDIQLAAGRYRIEVFRDGYRPVVLETDVVPGGKQALKVHLELLSVRELTALIERQFNASRYSEAIELAQLTLGQKSTKQGAQLLLGASLLRTGRHGECLEPLVGAMLAGEQILLPLMFNEPKNKPMSGMIRHGFIVVRSTGIGLVSSDNIARTEFLVPWSKVTVFRWQSGYLRLEVSLGQRDRVAVPISNSLNIFAGPVKRPELRAGDVAARPGLSSVDKPKGETFLLFPEGVVVRQGRGSSLDVQCLDCPATLDILDRLVVAVKPR